MRVWAAGLPLLTASCVSTQPVELPELPDGAGFIVLLDIGSVHPDVERACAGETAGVDTYAIANESTSRLTLTDDVSEVWLFVYDDGLEGAGGVLCPSAVPCDALRPSRVLRRERFGGDWDEVALDLAEVRAWLPRDEVCSRCERIDLGVELVDIGTAVDGAAVDGNLRFSTTDPDGRLILGAHEALYELRADGSVRTLPVVLPGGARLASAHTSRGELWFGGLVREGPVLFRGSVEALEMIPMPCGADCGGVFGVFDIDTAPPGEPFEIFAILADFQDRVAIVHGTDTSTSSWQIHEYDVSRDGGQTETAVNILRTGPGTAIATIGSQSILRFGPTNRDEVVLPATSLRYEVTQLLRLDERVLVGTTDGRFYVSSPPFLDWRPFAFRYGAEDETLAGVTIREMRRIADERFLIAADLGFLALLATGVDDPTLDEPIAEACRYPVSAVPTDYNLIEILDGRPVVSGNLSLPTGGNDSPILTRLAPVGAL